MEGVCLLGKCGLWWALRLAFVSGDWLSFSRRLVSVPYFRPFGSAHVFDFFFFFSVFVIDVLLVCDVVCVFLVDSLLFHIALPGVYFYFILFYFYPGFVFAFSPLAHLSFIIYLKCIQVLFCFCFSLF